MLCPNEKSCLKNKPRALFPSVEGRIDVYEHLTSDNLLGDVCGFEISLPGSTDLNDYLYLRIEYLKGVNVTIFRGTTLARVTETYNGLPG